MAETPPKKSAEAVVNEQVSKDIDNGYRGIKVDKTPNENYTVAGVTAGKPTPETDTK